MKLLLVLALATLAAARPFSDEWEDFKKVYNFIDVALISFMSWLCRLGSATV